MSKLKVNAIIELGGFPKEHIEATMKDVIEKVRSLKDTKILNTDTADIKENKQMFTTFTEFDLEFSDFEALLIFSFNFLPSTLEILEPSNINLKMEELQELMNSLLSKLHQYDLGVKRLFLENQALKKQINPDQKK